MLLDRFGTPIGPGDIVVQDCRKDRSVLREIIEVDVDGRKARLGAVISYRGVCDRRPTWVGIDMLAKYFDQEIMNVRSA